MSKITVHPSISAPRRYEDKVRNGLVPSWATGSRISNGLNKALVQYRKCVFQKFVSHITPTQGVSGTDNVLWRFYFHTGHGSPNGDEARALQLWSHILVRHPDNTNSADPNIRIAISDGNTTLYSYRRHLALVDTDALTGDDLYDIRLNIKDLKPNTRYEGWFEVSDWLRVMSAVCYERHFSVVSTDDDAVTRNEFGDGLDITEEQHNEMCARNPHRLWAKNGTHHFTLVPESAIQSSDAWTTTSNTYANILDATTTVTANTAGFTLHTNYHDAVHSSNVPCVFAAYGSMDSIATGSGNVQLRDDSGTLATLTFDSVTDGWVVGTCNLDGTKGGDGTHKVDVYYRGGGGSDDIRIYSVVLFELHDDAGVGATLLDLDYGRPREQKFPITGADLEAFEFGDPSYIWNFEEANDGDAILDQLQGKLLTVANSPKQGHRMHGFFDGTDMRYKRCVETTDGGGERIESDEVSLLEQDDNTQSYAFLIVFRIFDVPTTDRDLFSKAHSSANGRYRLYIDSSGQLVWQVIDTAASAVTVTAAANHADGAPHVALVYVDRNANEQGIYTDLANATNTPPAASQDSDEHFRIGRGPGLAAGMQVAYLASFEGTGAEMSSQASAAITNFWEHGKINAGPQQPSTKTRASVASSTVFNDSTNGDYVAKWSGVTAATLQWPYGYESTFTHKTKLGVQFEPAYTNLILRSEEFDVTWTTSNCTVAADQTTSPDGATNADELTATAANGYVTQTVTTIPANTYCGSVWVKRSGSADVAGRILLYDTVGASEDAGTAFTADSTWQRVSITAAVTSVSTALRIRVDTNAEKIYVWGAQMGGSTLTSYVPTLGSTTTRAATDLRYTVTSADIWDAAQGEARVTYATFNSPPAIVQSLLEVQGTGNQDRSRMMITTTPEHDVDIYDNASALQDSFTGGTFTSNKENVFRLRWDSNAGITSHTETADLYTNSARTAGTSSSTWTTGSTTDTIYVGYDTFTSALIGLISRIIVYNEPQSDNG